MDNFSAFMKNPKNLVPTQSQHTQDVEGYYFTGKDGSQIACWTCHADRTSEPHRYNFDEYIVCVQGQYTVIIDGRETVLKPGDEFFIPKGTLQGGRCRVGTRTIHVFGGKIV
jgi:quercetin dioxygenase-like cupin family protein